jgi:hypothetical protein
LVEGKELKLLGVIASLPQQSASGVRFRFQVQSASEVNASHNVVVPEWIDLAWYDRESADWLSGRHWADLKAGDTWQFNVRLKAPHGTLNPGGFDEALWRWEQGVMATGSVLTGKRAEAPQKIQTSWLYPVAQARQYVRSEIERKLVSGDAQSRSKAGVIDEYFGFAHYLVCMGDGWRNARNLALLCCAWKSSLFALASAECRCLGRCPVGHTVCAVQWLGLALSKDRHHALGTEFASTQRRALATFLEPWFGLVGGGCI